MTFDSPRCSHSPWLVSAKLALTLVFALPASTAFASVGSQAFDLALTGSDAVACTSSTNCWVVGSSGNSSGAVVNIASHWKGSTWSQIATPNPDGVTSQSRNYLLGVTCVSRTNCWAVGQHDKLNQALHWNGHTWSLVPTPNARTTDRLDAVACTSATNCWAVGIFGSFKFLFLHWNGHTWSLVPTPSHRAAGQEAGLTGVACASATNCWAVGYDSYRMANSIWYKTQNEALRWNGHKWSLVSVPKLGGYSELSGIACMSATNCMAVGQYQTKSLPTSGEALRWNGHKWSGVSVPKPALSGPPYETFWLSGVACTASTNCWAIGGTQSNGNLELNVFHWNGHRWSGVSAPEPDGPVDFSLNSIACGSPKSCWAIGVNVWIYWNGTEWSF
jgi:hypothetical protein